MNDEGGVVVTGSITEHNSSQTVAPFAAKGYFAYYNLLPNPNTIITSDTFNHYSYGSVNLRVYQYPSTGTETASMMYTLRASESGSKILYGNYVNTTGTVTWTNVPPAHITLR